MQYKQVSGSYDHVPMAVASWQCTAQRFIGVKKTHPFIEPKKEIVSASIAQSNPSAVSRERVTQVLLWVSVFAWGLLLAATLFDLRILAGAGSL